MAGIRLYQPDGVGSYNDAGATHPAAITVTPGQLCYFSLVGITTTTTTWSKTNQLPTTNTDVLSSTSSPGPTLLPTGTSCTITCVDQFANVYQLDINVAASLPAQSVGPTASRPTSGLVAGYQYYDTTIGASIWWNGSAWKLADGRNPTVPSSVGNGSLQFWVRGDRSVTIGSTLKLTGTSPAVTISGTQPGLLGLRIDITTGGTRGNAFFKWSTDNGLTYTTGVQTAATVVLGNTGITAAFAAGTYVLNDKYEATVSQWSDLSGNNNHVTQGTASLQPKYLIYDANGEPAIQLDGTDDFLARQNTTLNITTAYCIATVMKADRTASTEIYLAVSDIGGASGFYVWQINPNRAIRHVTTGSDGTDAAVQSTLYEVWTLNWTTGSAPVLRINGVAQSLSTAPTTMVAPVASSTLCIGSRNTGVDFWGACRFAEIAIFNAALSASDIQRLESYLRGRYATP